MANSVYKVTEIIGTSKRSWEDAARSAVQTAAASLRELRVAEVTELDMTVENGKVQAYRAKVKLSFKYAAAPTSAAATKTVTKKKVTKKKVTKKKVTKKKASKKKAKRKKRSRRR